MGLAHARSAHEGEGNPGAVHYKPDLSRRMSSPELTNRSIDRSINQSINQFAQSIAAVAIANNMSRQSVTASGVTIGAAMFMIGVTGLIDLVNAIVPREVVSGLQVGVGIKLATLGIGFIDVLPWISQLDCITLGLLCSALALVLLKIESVRSGSAISELPSSPEESSRYSRLSRRLSRFLPPSALTLFLLGMIGAAITLSSTSNSSGQYDLPLKMFGPPVAYWAVGDLTPSDWTAGLFELALPQLPLTTLNSVVSVCVLVSTLYPERRKNGSGEVLSRREVAVSVGLMNGVFCLFGAMPNCHGAGGLAGQHKFGARTGASVIFLGLLKIFFAVFFGASALTLLDAIPMSILGVLLIISGIELCVTGISLTTSTSKKDKAAEVKTKLFTCISTAVVIIGTGRTDYGFLAGIAVFVLHGSGIDEYAALIRGLNCGSSCCKKCSSHLKDDKVEEKKNDPPLQLAASTADETTGTAACSVSMGDEGSV